MATPLTVLVIEDDENDFHAIHRALQSSEYALRVHWTHDGADAQAYLAGEGDFSDRKFFPLPDIIVTDLRMPRMSGFEFLEWVSEHPQFRNIPLIVMSSSNARHDIERAYASGATTFFVKPFDSVAFARLLKTIADYWSQSITAAKLEKIEA